jgi:hypothetical protein
MFQLTLALFRISCYMIAMRDTGLRFQPIPRDPNESPQDRLLAGLREAAEWTRDRQLFELGRMRRVGLVFVRRLELSAKGKLDPEIETVFAHRSKGIIRDYATIVRAVRQILLLEQELRGIRKPRRDRKAKPEQAAVTAQDAQSKKNGKLRPLGDNLTEYYDFRPVGEAIGFIREALAIEPPENDPFPKPERKTAEPEPAETAEAVPPDPEAQAVAQTAVSLKPSPVIHAPAETFHQDLGHALVFMVVRPGPWARQPPRGPP